ncbi:MAG: DUF488 domain-containing protein [Gammaproteobacteria bacterium]|nr:DUF488 domain-containing protein [Gammaproteobacteria bacterium]
MTVNPILTIGHSNHSWEAFADLLNQHRVDTLADVRSVPASRFNPQFNRSSLSASLHDVGIGYVFRGGELGGRPQDSACYENGRVRYDRMAKTATFRRGLALVKADAAHHRVVLVCAEKDPLDCHRTLLVARALATDGVDVLHVLWDGIVETHDQAMDRLLASYDLETEGDLFTSRDELIAQAIERQTQRVGYVDDKRQQRG